MKGEIWKMGGGLPGKGEMFQHKKKGREEGQITLTIFVRVTGTLTI